MPSSPWCPRQGQAACILTKGHFPIEHVCFLYESILWKGRKHQPASGTNRQVEAGCLPCPFLWEATGMVGRKKAAASVSPEEITLVHLSWHGTPPWMCLPQRGLPPLLSLAPMSLFFLQVRACSVLGSSRREGGGMTFVWACLLCRHAVPVRSSLSPPICSCLLFSSLLWERMPMSWQTWHGRERRYAGSAQKNGLFRQRRQAWAGSEPLSPLPHET